MKKFKNLLIALSLTVVAVMLASCTSVYMVPISEHSSFPADGQKYEILGRVTVDTTMEKSGYTRLLEAAKEKYPGADDVVNIVVDAKQKETTHFFFFRTVRNTYVMSGIAISYK